MTVHRDKFLITKPTRCTYFSNLFLEWNSTYFGQFLCPSSGVFHCTDSNGICQTGLLTACEQYQDGSILILLASCQQTVWQLPMLCVQWKTPDDGERNCPKHVEFHSKIKFEKLVHLVGFIMIYIYIYIYIYIFILEMKAQWGRSGWRTMPTKSADVGVTSGERKFILLAALPGYSETHFDPLSVHNNE